MTQLEKIKIRLDITDTSQDALLNILLEDTEADILDKCNLEVLPEKALPLQRELVIIYYNKNGSEGEASRSEGGVSVTYEMPQSIKSRLKAFRKLRGN